MWPIEIIAFAPVVFLGLGLFSLILGAAAGTVAESFEDRAGRRPSASRQAEPPEHEHSRAA